jgi:hypothetical protein
VFFHLRNQNYHVHCVSATIDIRGPCRMPLQHGLMTAPTMFHATRHVARRQHTFNTTPIRHHNVDNLTAVETNDFDHVRQTITGSTTVRIVARTKNSTKNSTQKAYTTTDACSHDHLAYAHSCTDAHAVYTLSYLANEQGQASPPPIGINHKYTLQPRHFKAPTALIATNPAMHTSTSIDTHSILLLAHIRLLN